MGRLSEKPSVLSQPGDVCQSCMPFWTSRGKDPQRLIAVDSKVTDKKGVPVVVCPWCDGPVADLTNNGDMDQSS